MLWVLIIWVAGEANPNITTAEFNSVEVCTRAVHTVQSLDPMKFQAVCVQKG